MLWDMERRCRAPLMGGRSSRVWERRVIVAVGWGVGMGIGMGIGRRLIALHDMRVSCMARGDRS